MYLCSEYAVVLSRRGWHLVSSKRWMIETRFDGKRIYLDFSEDKKGVLSCKDREGQPFPVDFIEEFDEVVVFRRKQEEIEKGIPQDWWEIGG